MEIILNELSLHGQYLGLNDFAERGLTPLAEIFRKIVNDNGISILKNHDFYNAKVYSDTRLHEIMYHVEFRRNERLRQFKSYLARFQNKPYWNEDQRHRRGYDYQIVNGDRPITVTGHDLAEAYARDASVISFAPSEYETELIEIACKELDVIKSIDNIRNHRHLLSVRYKKGEITLDEYIKRAFAKRFNFDEISASNGLNLISDDNMDVFMSCFEDFAEKDWQSIITDSGLDYKPFNKNRNTKKFFDAEKWDKGVWKFRIDREKRCFGHREGEMFYVWRIDLDHKLSDWG